MPPTPLEPITIRLPNLISYCSVPPRLNPRSQDLNIQSAKWLEDRCPQLTKKQRAKLYGLRAGHYSALVFPTCDGDRLRVISDFILYSFLVDDITDGMTRSEVEAFADVIMNAFWFVDSYRPTTTGQVKQSTEEIPVGKIAREYVTSSLAFHSHRF